jgi:hypothetical protein
MHSGRGGRGNAIYIVSLIASKEEKPMIFQPAPWSVSKHAQTLVPYIRDAAGGEFIAIQMAIGLSRIEASQERRRKNR